MNRNHKLILIVILLAVVMQLFSGEIRFNPGKKEFQLFNSTENKILNYIILQPGEKITLKAIDVDTLTVYSRIISPGSEPYNYLININGIEKIVNRTASISRITKTLSGQIVSSYNSFKKALSGNAEIYIKNTWHKDILFKFVANKNERDFNNYEYVRFSPQYYDNEVTLNVSEKLYTYYQVNNSNIAFDLEGPVLVKIVSRLIFNDNFQNNKGYRYTVYDNDVEIASFQEKATLSGKAFFPDMPDKTPSSGDTNILQIPAGKHHIVIKDGILNRELIFRFYINKSSIGITE